MPNLGVKIKCRKVQSAKRKKCSIFVFADISVLGVKVSFIKRGVLLSFRKAQEKDSLGLRNYLFSKKIFPFFKKIFREQINFLELCSSSFAIQKNSSKLGFAFAARLVLHIARFLLHNSLSLAEKEGEFLLFSGLSF